MKFKVTEAFLAVFISISAVGIAPYANASENGDYVCAQQQGIWTTFVRTPRGLSPLIRWTSDQVQGWSPKRRCVAVAERMQRLSDNGTFNYAVDGILNSQSVVCGVRRIGDRCDDKNTIVTLPPGVSRQEAVDKLLNVSNRANGVTLNIEAELSNETSDVRDSLFNEVKGSTYIDMEILKEVINKVENPL